MKLKLHWQILIALILGVAGGVLFPQFVPYVSWIGDIFLRALGMIVVPLILCSIVTSLIDIQKSKFDLKSTGTRTISLYVMTMVIAILTGWALVRIIEPGVGVDLIIDASALDSIEQKTVSEILIGIIPNNMFGAFTTNNTLPVILIGFLLGIFIPKVDFNHQSVFENIFKGGLDLMTKITSFIIKFAPYGIFAIVAKQFSQTADFLALMENMMMYVFTVILGLFIHMFVWLQLILRFVFKVSPWKHMSNMSTPLITSFSTASSGATLPLTLYAVEHKNGISKDITNFTIPLGTAINMDGTALLECVGVIFIAQVYGVELSFIQQLIVAFTALLSAIGAAAIPMAGLVTMTIILYAVGLPIEGIGLIIGVDRILDMMRTSVNVYGDACVATMMAKIENEKLPIDLK
jgi:Na+/H+-dicarboxylate symporters